MDWVSQPQPEQTGEAWHSFRGKGIGSSDMPVIMKVSPWKTLYDLWLEKTDQLPEEKKFKGNFATERGTRLEPLAREMYEKRVGALFKPEIAVHKTLTFARASFDGINHELKRVLEIKCPGKKSHDEALNGVIPEVYYPQCQWLMVVSGYNDLDYVSWDGKSDQVIILPLKADIVYQTIMINEAAKFWRMVQDRVPPEQEPQLELNLEEKTN